MDADDPQSAFVFAYGQTAGKTYTLMGPEFGWSEPKHDLHGLFRRVVDDANDVGGSKTEPPRAVAAFRPASPPSSFISARASTCWTTTRRCGWRRASSSVREASIKTASDTTR